MKKSIKEVVALMLVTVMLATMFIGCSDSSGAVAPGNTNGGGNTVSDNANKGGSLTFRDVYKEKIKIAYLPLGTGAASGPAAAAGLAYAVKDLDNVTVDIFDPNYDLNQQISLLNECATQGYDAIILCALDTEALNSTVAEVEAMGIPVITQNNNISGIHSAKVSGDSYMIGILAAQGMHEYLGNEANVIMLDCDAANLASAFMSKGFEEWAEANTNWKITSPLGLPKTPTPPCAIS